MRILVAMSGGVDSSAAAALLLDEGHDVSGAFLRNGVAAGRAAAAGKQGCCSVGDAADAARVAEILGIPFRSLDFAEGFRSIVRDFADDYARGRTPNPCIACNRDLKFGRLLAYADAIGADAVATGHYAEATTLDGRRAIRTPRDRAKDQTYVLFPLSQEQLRRTVFPLASLTKDETRRIAAARGLPVAEKPESMEICFVPDGDYRAVVGSLRPDALRPGDIVDEATGAVVGTHAGIGSVTIGQRRGIGAVGPEPRYVTAIDVAANRVVVGPDARLLRHEVVVEGWNPVGAATPAPGAPLRGLAKVRRNHVPVPAVARWESGPAGVGVGEPSRVGVGGPGGAGDGEPGRDGDGERGRVGACEPGRVVVEFADAVRAPAPGQALVLYSDDGVVLGGGWISSAR